MRAPLSWAALAFSVGMTACLFPDYTFDEPEPSGGGGSGNGGSPNGAAGGGGSNTGAGSTGGEGGEGGMPPTENCFTPGDEDNDGAADCADSDCDPDLECIAAIPVGWGAYGYAALFRGSTASDPACPDGTNTDAVYTGNGNLMNTDSECSACDCDNPVGQGCVLIDDTFGQFEAGLQPFYTRDVPCAIGTANDLNELTLPNPWDFMCTALDTAPGGLSCGGGLPCNRSVKSQPATVTPGTCTPTGGEPSGGEPTWGEGVKACRSATTLQGCDAGLTCIPRPPAPFEPRTCIGKVGDHECPAGPFTLRSQSFSGFEDTRECSECTCGDSSGGSCKITLSLHTDTSCTSANPILLQSGSCVDLSGNPTISGRTASITTPPSGGSCPVTGGGVPSGSVTETNPTTFCCLPDD
ncbi:MAG: hypothetical protein HOW73_14505 [Polyangiaceae bacterium]|nr:hypothetical protein [Polyangiaceae bacterium]